jgi:methionyl aminopeptidase
MIKYKSEKDIAMLRESGRRLAEVLYKVAEKVKPGVKTGELDDYAFDLIKELGDKPAFKNYRPEGSPLAYPASLCTSINDVVVHGFPSNRVLKEGDIISLDLGVNHQGYFSDMAITVPVGEISPSAEKLIETTKEALDKGIAEAKVGNHLGDIGSAVQTYAEGFGYGVVRELSGHGVGFAPHEDPFVPNFGKAGQGIELKPGLVIAIEPMICLGTGDVVYQPDGFSFKTKDGKLAAHFEHTVVVTENGPEILTKV